MSTEIDTPKTKSAAETPAPAGKPSPVEKAPAPAAKRKPRKKDPKAAKEKKKLPPPTRMTDAGYGALKALKAANPEMSHTEIVSAALIAMSGKTAYMPPLRMRRIATEELLILAGIAADSETTLKVTFRKIIRAKIEPAQKKELVNEVQFDLQNMQQLRRTISRIAGIPINASYDSDARDLIKELTEKKDAAPKQIDQMRYETGIIILSAYTSELSDDTTDLNP